MEQFTKLIEFRQAVCERGLTRLQIHSSSYWMHFS